MRIKIVGDGTPRGTTVVDADTGERLEGVTAVEWQMDARNLATAKITLLKVPVEVEAEATVREA